MPCLVRQGLFFGNITDAIQTLTSQSNPNEITHVLSLLSSASISFFTDYKPDISIETEGIKKVYAKEMELGKSGKSSLSPEKLVCVVEKAGVGLKMMRMAVPLRDTEDEDLLDYLDICLDFIDEGRRDGGSVLVHCFAGVSRSAAIIIAYLMRTEQKTQEEAIESLKEAYEFVCPNDGFLDQLKLFEDMGYKVDSSNPLYKRFRLKVLGHSYKLGEKVDSSIFETDPGLSQESDTAEKEDTPQDKKTKSVYCCKKCQRVVALPENIVSHTPGEGESCSEWQKTKSSNTYKSFGEMKCNSMFVEPLKWMTTVEEGALEGKLCCIKCSSGLGYFSWSGIQCSCGSWITPAFQILKNKVDLRSAVV